MATSIVLETAHNIRLRYNKTFKQQKMVGAKPLLLATIPVYVPYLRAFSLPTTGQPYRSRTCPVVSHLGAWLFSVPYPWSVLCSLFKWLAYCHPSCVTSDFSCRAVLSNSAKAGHLWHQATHPHITFLISLMAFTALCMPSPVCSLTSWSAGFPFGRWAPGGLGPCSPLYL